MPPYEELFSSGRGFTAVDEASFFAKGSGCDWLSVAIGNNHGAIAAGRKDLKKVEARLNLDRLSQLYEATRIPLVLHGGSGIQQTYILEARKHGITKINVATEIRQPYETTLKATGNILKAQQAAYERGLLDSEGFLEDRPGSAKNLYTYSMNHHTKVEIYNDEGGVIEPARN